MKVDFEETIHLKTEQELHRISKDTAFYSDEERLLALEVLEKRGVLPRELANDKANIASSIKRYPILENTPTGRVYKPWMLYTATYAGGPLAAGYILAANFRTFGEPERARKAWIYSIVATVAILVIILSIPEKVLDAIPKLAIPLLYTGAAYLLMQHFQDQNIGSHLVSGGRSFSWGRTILVGMISAAVTVVIPMCIIMFFL